jgi:putative tricarboxylic transport membrane protein
MIVLRTFMPSPQQLATVYSLTKTEITEMMSEPLNAIEIVAGTPPGGGLDRTARALAKALVGARAFDTPVIVRNVPGDGARRAWAYMDEHRGNPNVVSISHPNLTSDRLLGLASFDHSAYTPIATLYTEYIAFAVEAASPLKTPEDLLARMGERTRPVAVALSTSLGNPNHVALARLARHVGSDPRSPNVRVFDSALDAVGDVIQGSAEVAAVTAPSTVAALRARDIRVLAVSAPARLSGDLSAVPTWHEHGVACVIGAWRGISGAQGIEDSDRERWEHAIRSAIATRAWQDDLASHGWAACHLEGPALRAFLERERADTAAALEELGLLR